MQRLHMYKINRRQNHLHLTKGKRDHLIKIQHHIHNDSNIYHCKKGMQIGEYVKNTWNLIGFTYSAPNFIWFPFRLQSWVSLISCTRHTLNIHAWIKSVFFFFFSSFDGFNRHFGFLLCLFLSTIQNKCTVQWSAWK